MPHMRPSDLPALVEFGPGRPWAVPSLEQFGLSQGAFVGHDLEADDLTGDGTARQSAAPSGRR
jgi:hypothetical protein